MIVEIGFNKETEKREKVRGGGKRGGSRNGIKKGEDRENAQISSIEEEEEQFCNDCDMAPSWSQFVYVPFVLYFLFATHQLLILDFNS